MEAISNRINKKRFTGRIAALMVKIGAATSVEDLRKQEEEARLLKEQEEAKLKAAEEQKLKDQEADLLKKQEEEKAEADGKAEEEKTAEQETEKVKLIKSTQPVKKPAAKRKRAPRKAVKRVKK